MLRNYSFTTAARYLLISACCLFMTACSTSSGESQKSERELDRAYQRSLEATREGDFYPSRGGDPERQADEAEATSLAEYYEDMERDVWESHLDELEILGSRYATDPTASSEPGAVDCDDFAFQEEADAFFIGAGGPEIDLFLLDEDGDTIACELLPEWFPGVEWSSTSGPP